MAEHTPPSAAELADRLRAMAARFPTIDSIVAECRHRGIKGEPGCGDKCLVARLVECHCDFTPDVCASDVREDDDGTPVEYLPAHVYAGKELVELPPHWTELIHGFDSRKYPDLESR